MSSAPEMSTQKGNADEKSEDEAAGKDESYQIFSAMSYAVILFLIGMPLWWKATEVYRVALPYDEIGALDNLEVKFVMNITISTLDFPRGEKLGRDLQSVFTNSKLFRVSFSNNVIDKQSLASIKSIDDLEAAPFHQKKPGNLLLLEVPGLARFTPHQILVGHKRTVYFSSDTSSLKLGEVLLQWLLQEPSLQRLKDAMTSPTLIDQDEGGKRRVPAAKQYDIMVTAVNPDPEAIQLDLDLKQAIKEYMAPLLTQLSVLTEFTVKSQWLYFVTLDVQPKLVPQKGPVMQHYALSEDILPHLITPLEKKLVLQNVEVEKEKIRNLPSVAQVAAAFAKLASHISANPCINFVVYVPTCSRAPLHIYRRQGMRLKAGPNGLDAFLSPRWGGIAVHNPLPAVCRNDSLPEPKIVVADTSRIMGTFLAQLRLLLGINEIEESSILKAGLVPLSSGSLRAWELDSLLRIRTLEQVTSATLTLQSLAQLLAEISNIVINDAVGASIFKAVESVEESAQFLAEGNLEAAFRASKEAFLSAEAAFTDPSLLALLYFPDDQKYAVYIPLFLPVMIPVLLSLRQIKEWLVTVLSSQKSMKVKTH